MCKGIRRLRGIEDASKWMPGMTRCWFAGRVVAGYRVIKTGEYWRNRVGGRQPAIRFDFFDMYLL